MFFGPTSSSIEYVRSGRLRALAVTLSERSEALPGIPLLENSCVATRGAVGKAWWRPRIRRSRSLRSSTEINAGLSDPKIKARFADLGVTPFATSAAEFGKFIVEYTAKWGKVIRTGNIKAE